MYHFLYVIGIIGGLVYLWQGSRGCNNSRETWFRIATYIAGTAVIVWGLLGLYLVSSNSLSSNAASFVDYSKGVIGGVNAGALLVLLLAEV